MGIKRKKAGPAPNDKREEWQKLSDKGLFVSARLILLNTGSSPEEAVRAELAYRNRRHKE